MSLPVTEKPTIEVLAVGLAALNEIQRRTATEQLTTQYQRESINTVLNFVKRWFEREQIRASR